MTEFKITEPWEQDVRLWVPGEEQVSYGRLQYRPESGLTAQLLDSTLGQRGRRERAQAIPAIHGETLGGAPFCLLDPWITNTRVREGRREGNVVEVSAWTLVRGTHATSMDSVQIGRAGLRIHGLVPFLSARLGSPLFGIEPESGAHETLEVELGGTRMGFSMDVAELFGDFRRATELTASVWFRLERPVSLREFDERFASPVCDLVEFGVQEPVFVESLQAGPTADAPDALDEALEEEIEIVRPPRASLRSRPSSRPHALMLNLGSLPDPRGTIKNWFELRDRLGPIWPFFFGSLRTPEVPLENKLLNLTSFAEGYHRTLHDNPPLTAAEHEAACEAMLSAVRAAERNVYRGTLTYANSQSQRQRIRWLVDRARSVLDAWALDAREFTSQVVDTRNWLTHWGERGEDVQEGEGQAHLFGRMELVLRVNLLLDLGLDKNAVAKQVESGLRWRLWP